jgi:hypothetical protein
MSNSFVQNPAVKLIEAIEHDLAISFYIASGRRWLTITSLR